MNVEVLESESEISSSDIETSSDRECKAKLKIAKEEEELMDSEDDDEVDLIEYLDEKTDGLESELNPTGQYFVCYDVI